MTGDLAVITHHKTRMSSGRKHVQSQTFPFGNRESAGVVLVVGHPLDERPEISLNLQHFLGPNSPAQVNMLHPGAWKNEVRPASEKREIHSAARLGGLFGQVRGGLVEIVWTANACTPSLFLRPEVFQVADRLYFCLARPAACPPGCRSCEFHAALAPIVGKWIDGF